MRGGSTLLEDFGRRAAFAEIHVARSLDGQILYPRDGHFVPSPVAPVHLFVIDPLDAPVTVCRNGDDAFAVLALDHVCFEYVTGDAAGMLEVAFAMIVSDRLMFPER